MSELSSEGMGEASPPESKKLRYTEPDLTIVVKYSKEDREGNEEVQVQKEYQMYSQLLANLSKFIDTALSVEMKEKTARKIVFRDVTPELFELALRYQQDFNAIRSMTAAEAVKLVKFYDQYEFTGGLELCDGVLSDFLKEHTAKDITIPPDNLDLVVDAAAVSFDFNLPRAKCAAIAYVTSRMKFDDDDKSDQFGPTMFSPDHIRKLHPMFKTNLLTNSLPSTLTEEELHSTLFPKYFVSWAAGIFCCHSCNSIVLSGTQLSLDGEYMRIDRFFFRSGRTILWKGRMSYLYVARHDPTDGYKVADWSIVIQDEENDSWEVLWTCPYSRSLEVPPKGPWIPVDTPKKDASPRLRYKK